MRRKIIGITLSDKELTEVEQLCDHESRTLSNLATSLIRERIRSND